MDHTAELETTNRSISEESMSKDGGNDDDGSNDNDSLCINWGDI